MSMQKVEAAAAFLDTYGPANWRAKVNLEALDMASTDKCILGQVYGRYGRGYDKLCYKPGFSTAAFCDYDLDWKTYLRRSSSADKYAGTEWVGRHTNNSVKTIKSVDVDGELFIAYKIGGGSALVRSEADFLADYKAKPTKPTYVVGQLYTSADKKYVFMYNGESAYPQMYRLNGGGSYTGPGHAEASFYERQNGPLTPLQLSHTKNEGKAVHATVK